ncbi:Fc.00g107910.m01.CDS01 [Cosmosporella sp. VM-42]
MSGVLEDVSSKDIQDDSYVSRQGSKIEPLPVQSDDMKIEDPIDAATADSDKQLERDDVEAIDTSNIIKDRTRHAQPTSGYQEPGDTEGLPDDTGRSSADQHTPDKNAKAYR